MVLCTFFGIFGIKYFSLSGHINKLCFHDNPLLKRRMAREHDFVASLTKAGQDAATIKKLSNAAHGSKALSLSQIYWIIADVRAGKGASDKRHLNPKMTKRTLDIIKAVREFVEADRHVTIRDISEAFALSDGTIRNILHDDLDLVKRTARWVPKKHQCLQQVG